MNDISHPCALNEVSQAIASTLDPYGGLRPRLRAIARMTNADVVGAYALEDNGEWLTPVQGYHLPPEVLDGLRAAKLSLKTNSLYEESCTARRPLFAANALEDTSVYQAVRATIPHRAQMFVPVTGQAA
jgi:hypothetical protein